MVDTPLLCVCRKCRTKLFFGLKTTALETSGDLMKKILTLGIETSWLFISCRGSQSQFTLHKNELLGSRLGDFQLSNVEEDMRR